MPKPITFNALAWGQKLDREINRLPKGEGHNRVLAETGVSKATLSRARNGWQDISHLNFLRLDAWLQARIDARQPQSKAA